MSVHGARREDPDVDFKIQKVMYSNKKGTRQQQRTR